MESVIMTSPGSSTRLKGRLRNATFLTRNSKNRQPNNAKSQHNMNMRNNRSCNRSNNPSKNGVNVRHLNNINKNQEAFSNGNSISAVGNVNLLYKGKFAR